ncbi:hypothetical protein GCM10022243_05250 [Saccharothrix violaceirubra]|uniref:Uncharacterized protein YukE n=1 Tax=Saccharothrix violaceirubra TaxID=413306 RepID=A0A7W7SXT1_9PSEU|nr:hypothetical protein [Saccharothrix violaceirubra]MBB4962935.1 uncharacterized protein YukE [Saccharothrix violaceirubra]
MAGFGVGPGELQNVAKQYQDHGADIIQMKSGVTPAVGAGQVGRKFRGVETKYRSYFDRLGASMETFGTEANNVAQRLNDVAKSYESNESATSGQFQG